MENLNVRSATRPKEVEVFPAKDCWMRKNITEHEDEENGEYFEYDEVFFISDATEAEIEADFDTFYNVGRDWQPPVEPVEPTWQQRIEAQLTYTAHMTGTRL